MKIVTKYLLCLFTLVLFGRSAFGQAPTISYGTPAPSYVFPLNTAITPISPTTSTGVTGSFNNTTSTFYNAAAGTTFGVVTYDAFSGNFYAVANGTLYKITSAGVATQINTTTMNNANSGTGIITDGLGNVYVSDGSSNDLFEFSSTGTLIRTITGLNTANGVAVDASNNVYVADANTNDVYKIAAGVSTTKTAILTGFTTPYGLAINTATGDMYVTQNGGTNATRSIIKIANAAGGGTTKTTFVAGGSGLTGPRDLTFDAFGDLFLADGTTVKMISPTGTVTTALTGLTGPGQVDFDPSGNMYIADAGRTIKESAVSYYTISAALPTGLLFNTSTGVVTGTPTAAAGPTLYTVTAHNTTGTATAQFTITCKVLAPVISYTTPVTLVVGTPATLTPTNTSSPITSASVLPALPAGLSISATGVISGTPTAVTAAANYVVTASNAGGAGAPFTINITVNPKLPAITYTTPNVYTTGVAITPLNPNTSAGGAVASYAISPALPAGLSIDPVTGIISGTPTGTATIATYTVTATNVTGNGTFGISITVNPPKPVITYSTPQTYVVGTAIATLSAGNTGGPIVSFSVLPALPAGLTLNTTTGDITGTPTAQSVATNYVVTATNAGGNGAFTINITVLPMPPVISYTTPNVFLVGTAYTLNPTSSGGPVVSYAVSPALPAGLSIASGTGIISGTPTAVTAATDYVVTATNANSSTTFTVNITVNNPPVPVFTYTNPAAITYGASIPSVTPVNSGGIPTSCTISPTGTGIVVSAAGVVSGTPNAAGTTTYTITPSNAGGTGAGATITITVNQALLTVTANNQTKVYGAALPTLTFAYSGFQNGDNAASLTTGATVTTTATAASPVSPPTYPITASGVVDPNYTFNYVAGALTITKAALTITATAQTKTYGTAFTFAGTEFTTSALQPGDAVTSVTLTSGGAAATATVAGSTYTIVPSAAVGTGLSNYTITYVNSTFTVTKAALTVTANNQTKVYGSTFTFAGTEFTTGAGQLKNTDKVTSTTITSTGSVATATVAGSPYPIVISTAVGTGLANYNITYVNGSMTVTPAPVTITAVSQTRDVGIVTTLTVTYSGLQNGATTTTTLPTITTTAIVTSPVGMYPITASGAADPNYTISYVAGTLTITASGTHTYTWDWTAAANTTWENPANWDIAGVPQTTNYPGSATNKDIADIGINILYNATQNPVITGATVSVTSINFGSSNTATNIGITVNGTLTTSSDITLQAQNLILGNNLNINLSGTGTINVPNLNVINNQTILSGAVASINSSVANLNVTGNITLTTTALVFSAISSKFVVTGGTTTVNGVLTTSNNPGFFAATTSTFSVSPTTTATLNLTNANAMNLDNNTSVIDFDHPGSTVNYNGTAASQTVYTNAATNASTGVNYRNLTISGTGTGVPQGGTLTVDQNMLTSGTTNFGTNAPTVTVAGTWTNTANVAQGAAIIAVNTQLINTSNTITGGTGTLTAASMEFNGGTLVAGAGTVTSTGTYQNDSGTFNCGTAANATVVFNGTYTNNGGIFIANPTSTSKVSFTGTNQTLFDKTTAGTTFNNVTFSGNNTAISGSTGNFAVANIGTLTMGANAKLTAGSGSAGGAGYLTLLSNASSTATVAAIPSTSSIQGAVNVQRFITGGAGTRGYRLLTSPINISGNAGGGGNLSLGYLNTNASFGGTTYLGAFTEGPGTGFTYNGSFNPIIYLYDESRPSTTQGFTAGKNIGIYSITGNSVITLTGSTQASANIPVGNSYLLYYVGDNHDATQGAVLTSRIPESIAITATGYLNQQSVPVKFWNTSSTNIPYDVTTGTSYPGLNQVGNPYPSTISLDVVATDNAAINKVFWELVPGGSYVSYNASNHAVSDARASKYILSGQGFLVEAQATGETLTFKETEKIAYPAGLVSPFNTAISTALLMDIKTKPDVNNSDVLASTDDKSFQAMLPPTSGLAGLHLQLTKDSLNFVQTGIYFDPANNDKFAQNEDAVSVNGSGAQVFLSSYSFDNVNVGINQLGDYSKGKRVRVYTGVASSGSYTISLADIANIDTVNYNVFLIDRKLNDSVDMIRNRSYAFNINNSDTSTWGANRFVLVIEHAAVPPYVLNSFTGTKVAAGVLLTWLTTNGSNYTGYILQKQSTDGSYTDMFSTQSDKGEAKYSYIDQNPIVGPNTYRLEQNDVYGIVTYSAPLTIIYNKNTLSKVGLSIFPNPSNSIINVIYTDRANTNPSPSYTVDIFNAAGTFIKHESVNSNAWTEDISGYKLGVYLLQLKDSNGQLISQTKFIKNL